MSRILDPGHLVDATFSDLQSQFLVLPRGPGFIEYQDFQQAYETLKSQTSAFTKLDITSVWNALADDALVFVVVRTILGFSPPEWAEVAASQTGMDIPQGAVRNLDRRVRSDRRMFAEPSVLGTTAGIRAQVLLNEAIQMLQAGAPPQQQGMIHRLDKLRTAGFDDLDILDINSQCAHLNYANRVVLGLGIHTIVAPDFPAHDTIPPLAPSN